MSIYTQLFDGMRIKPKGSLSINLDGATVYIRDLPLMFEPKMPPKIFYDYYALDFVSRKSKLRDEALALVKNTSGEAFEDDNGTVIDPNRYQPIRLVGTKLDRVLYDLKENCISDTYCFEGLMDMLLDKDSKALYRSKSVAGKIIFDPKDTRQVIKKKDYTAYNLYSPPAWRLVDVEPACPVDFQEFIEFLIPDAKARHYTLMWVREMLISQNHTYLILHGRKGIGKSALIQMLMHLVGKEYCDKPSRNWLETHFNAWLENKRLIYSEECSLSNERHEPMKDVIEGDQSITKKGQDSLQSAPIHASFILTNNKIQHCYAEWDDRRFSYIELATGDYYAGQEKFKDLIGGILTKCEHNLEYLAQLGHWFLNLPYEFDSRMPHKAAAFYKIVTNSLPTWQKALVLCAKEGKPNYPLSEIRKKWENPQKMEWPKEITVQDFVAGFRPENHRLGIYENKVFYPYQGDENGRNYEQEQGLEL